MTRRHLCRCCGMPTESGYCPPCGSHHASFARRVIDALRLIGGESLVTTYKNTVAAQRLAGRRTTRPERTTP